MNFKSKTSFALVALAACGLGVPSLASAQAAATTAPAAPKYSTNKTQLGTLLADPAAKAVLAKHIPQLINGSQDMDQASGMTLKELQGAIKTYAPDLLTDKVLKEIDVDLAALPA